MRSCHYSSDFQWYFYVPYSNINFTCDPAIQVLWLCNKLPPNLLALNNGIYFLTDLQFEQGLTGIAHFSGSWCQPGWPEGWELESFLYSFTSLMLHAGLTRALYGTFMLPGLPLNMAAGLRESIPKLRDRERYRELAPGKRCILVSDLGLEVVQCPFCHMLFVAQSPAHVQEERN